MIDPDLRALRERIEKLESAARAGQPPPRKSGIACLTRGRWLVVALVAIPAAAYAANLTVPYAFTNGTPADANEVNDNFLAVEVAVNDNATRVASLEATGLLSGVTTVTDSGLGVRTATCPAGTTLIGGGAADTNGAGQLQVSGPSGNSWVCKACHYGTCGSTSVSCTALCAEVYP